MIKIDGMSLVVQELADHLHRHFPSTSENIRLEQMLINIDSLIKFPQPRDEFAMSALSGIMANPVNSGKDTGELSKLAYATARDMLKERDGV